LSAESHTFRLNVKPHNGTFLVVVMITADSGGRAV